MQDYELNNWIYCMLAKEGGEYVSFDQLDQILAKETPDWTDAIRRSYLRGELGLMIRAGQILRDKHEPKYRICDDINLF